MQNNSLFIGILVTTSFFQVLIVQFGSVAFKVYDGGLDARLWGYSILFGAMALPVKLFINVLFRICQYLNRHRTPKQGSRSTTTNN
jgi:hypothetical protein